MQRAYKYIRQSSLPLHHQLHKPTTPPATLESLSDAPRMKNLGYNVDKDDATAWSQVLENTYGKF
jgi:hypothetical protein